MAVRDCDCNNAKCPRSPNYVEPCKHCMCLNVPDVEIGKAISWGGPVGKQCCRCNRFQEQASWQGITVPGTTAYKVRVS